MLVKQYIYKRPGTYSTKVWWSWLYGDTVLHWCGTCGNGVLVMMMVVMMVVTIYYYKNY